VAEAGAQQRGRRHAKQRACQGAHATHTAHNAAAGRCSTPAAAACTRCRHHHTRCAPATSLTHRTCAPGWCSGQQPALLMSASRSTSTTPVSISARHRCAVMDATPSPSSPACTTSSCSSAALVWCSSMLACSTLACRAAVAVAIGEGGGVMAGQHAALRALAVALPNTAQDVGAKAGARATAAPLLQSAAPTAAHLGGRHLVWRERRVQPAPPAAVLALQHSAQRQGACACTHVYGEPRDGQCEHRR
jgi:hypothetical protein